MVSFFSFDAMDIEVKFDGEESREIIDSHPKHGTSRHHLAPLFGPHETVAGNVTLRPRNNRRVEHFGVKVQFIGTVEQLNRDKVTQSDEFISWAQELASPGELRHAETYPFEFRNIEKQWESYNGYNVRLRYFVRVTAFAKMSELERERDLWVYHYAPPPTNSHLLSMDVGIDGCLHIEFEYAKSHFSLTDTLVGRIYFMMARIKLRHMELSLIRKETAGQAPNAVSESENIVRYEVMDGAPVKGEQIPIRLHLSGFDLVPTMKDVNRKFSVRTYMSLVLVDESGRRYFKQTEIQLYRPPPELANE